MSESAETLRERERESYISKDIFKSYKEAENKRKKIAIR